MTCRELMAVLCSGLALFLTACVDPRALCPNGHPACQLTVPQPGMYMVTYIDADGNEQTAKTSTETILLSVCDCSRIIRGPDRVGGVPVDLSVSITGSPDAVTVGQNLTYVITVSNNSDFAATDGVRLIDQLPPELNFVSASASQATYDAANKTLTCDIDLLRARQSFSLTLIAEVVFPPADGLTKNSASVDLKFSPDPTNTDPDLANNAATVTTIVASADLSTTESVSPEPVAVGNSLTYNITVRNSGPSIATGVTVTDTLPSTVHLVFAASSQGRCTQSGLIVTCDVGSLVHGTTPDCSECALVTIAVTPARAGTIINTARVTANEFDVNLDNNLASATTTVIQPALSADLAVSMSALPDPAVTQETVTYNITVTNNGPDPATGLVLNDTLPPGVDLVGFPLGCSPSVTGDRVTCVSGRLASHGIYTASILVRPRGEGTITNNVAASAAETDPDTTNNTATTTTTVSSPAETADLSVTISDSPDPVVVNQQLTYSATITNNGLATATGVTLSGTLSPGVGFSGNSSCLAGGNNTFNCFVGSLQNGAVTTFSMVVTPTNTGTVTNTVGVSAVEKDLNTANNTATATTTVIPSATGPDLAVTIADDPDPVFFNDQLTYIITVTNHGPQPATGIHLTDLLQSVETAAFDITPSQGKCTHSDMTVTCDLGTLASGAGATVTIVGFPFALGTISNTATVTLNESDPNTANNTATEFTTVTEGNVVSKLFRLGKKGEKTK